MHLRLSLGALMMITLTSISSAQRLSGAYTIDPNGSGSRNYATFAAATKALKAYGVNGAVSFGVASKTFQEALAFTTVSGASTINTIRFEAVGSPATVQAGPAIALTLNKCGFFLFKNIHFDTTTGTYCLYNILSDDISFLNCKFAGGLDVVRSDGMDRCTFDSCEIDGKGAANRLLAPYNANDSDCLFQNCFLHDCRASGLGAYLNLAGHGIMFWHNTIIVNTTENAVHLGGCCAWSRANSFRNNIVVNMGSGVAVKYGFYKGALEFNDADYNCYYAPNGKACMLEYGTGFTTGTLAAWKKYFKANRSTLVPLTGPGPWPTLVQTRWDNHSLELLPGLVRMVAPYDIHLTSNSPCLDAGTVKYVAGGWISYRATYKVLNDFDGDLRPATLVDIGADESRFKMLAVTGTGKIGSKVDLLLDARTSNAGLTYQLGSSFAAGPIPIDTRKLGLGLDDLLAISVRGYVPMVFPDYSGALDANGKATAAIKIPNIPALDQMRIYTAFVTIKVGAPSNIKTISNTVMFTIVK